MTIHNEDVRVSERCPVSCGAVSRSSVRALLPNEAQQTIRLSAMATDANGGVDVDFAALWHELARSEYFIVDDFFSAERCYLVLGRRRHESMQPIEGRRLQILQAVLCGLPQTNIAIDLGLAPSTVALNSRLGLESLGVSGKPSRAHPLLMLAARAASEPSITAARASSFVINDRPLSVIGSLRPDCHLAKVLPTAELAVIRRLVEGHSYAEIAAERGTSTRTIANQITAVFRRLHVSGRNELLQRLLVDEGLVRLPPKVLTETFVSPLPPESTAMRRDTWRDARRSA